MRGGERAARRNVGVLCLVTLCSKQLGVPLHCLLRATRVLHVGWAPQLVLRDGVKRDIHTFTDSRRPAQPAACNATSLDRRAAVLEPLVDRP